jgi:nucleotide-binding universal stress UspA family protein
MFKRILVAVDGSPASNAGLKSGITFAEDQRAVILAVHIIDDGTLPVDFEGSIYPPHFVDLYYGAADKTGRKILDRAAAAAGRRGVRVEPVILRSRGKTVADVVIAQARKLKADIIVIGTHGRRGLERMLMGSDAEDVVRRASIPVLLVRKTQRVSRESRKPRGESSTGTRVRGAGKQRLHAKA